MIRNRVVGFILFNKTNLPPFYAISAILSLKQNQVLVIPYTFSNYCLKSVYVFFLSFYIPVSDFKSWR